MLSPHKPKAKKCAWSKCSKMFNPNPFRFNQKTCDNTMCAIGYVKEKQAAKEAKEWNKEKKKIKAELMSLSDHMQDLQKNYCNPYIRKRDKDEPCISCKIKHSNKWDAGHYVAAGKSNFLRFHEDNLHKQCSFNCNRSLHGNVIEYRINLIEKIGIERVIWLEENRHKEKHWTISELLELKQYYKQKIKELNA